uniref:Uncharacterized protein n=1 Tax=Desulfacinum infernum TaxID=35837 RepID=A0A832A141_9BACT
MANFEFNSKHIIDRLMERFRLDQTQACDVFDRVRTTLESHTPDDWRFTDSPSSRFFVVEERTRAKFFGMSYRTSSEGKKLVDTLRSRLHDPSGLARDMGTIVKDYIQEIQCPDLRVVHDMRTVYGTGPKAHIAEERVLVEQSRASVTHTVPFYARKIAARPNAAVLEDGTLWVRQYINWVGQDPNGSEYYVFQPLTKQGVDKSQFRVYAHAHNGAFQKVDECCVCANPDCRPNFPTWKKPSDVRTESYWKLPTYLDMLLADLDYCERYAAKGAPFSAEDLQLLYWLRRIADAARQELYRKL